jgi:hypothetical protein
MGLHCGTGNRRLPGRGRDGGRTGRTAAHGALGGGSPASRSARGPGTPGTSPCRRLYGPRNRHRGGRHRRRPRRPSVDRLLASGALDHRGDSLPTRTFGIAPVAVPNRA